jgi:hypothetical protein
MKAFKLSELSRIFPLSRCAAMGEGAQRASEGSSPTKRMLVKSFVVAPKSPHPAFGHLLPRSTRAKGNDSEGVA